MSQRNIAIAALALFVFTMMSATSSARSIRLDSGDWNNSGFLSSDSVQSLGFSFEMLGISASQASISTNGSVVLSGGGQSATLNPFFDASALGGGNTVSYQFGSAGATFAGNTPGVTTGFRVTWQVTDSSGALLNEYQLAMFELASGLFTLEFNFNSLLAGSDGAEIGYSTSLGDSYDLLANLGYGSFAEYAGVGNDEFNTSNCPSTPNALACNNYYANTSAFGTGTNVLPDLANGFFRQIDSNGSPVQGRYMWVFGDTAPVPAPGTLLLIGLGALMLVARLRK